MKLWARSIMSGVASALLLTCLCTWASAQSPRLKNIELCNGKDRSSPDFQIEGCTALIDSGRETTQTLAIAHNNRGNAYTAKGDYDRAIQDYDQSLKFNRGYARAFNNRGVV